MGTSTFTRRAFLAGLGATAAAGSGTAWSLSPGLPDHGLRVLTITEHRVVRALADLYFPGIHLPLSGSQAGVPEEVDRILAEVMDPLRASAFRYVLRALEWGTLAGRGQRFTALDAATQHEVLATWSTPAPVPRRVAGDSLKAVLGMAYFAHPDVRAAMGWRLGCGASS